MGCFVKSEPNAKPVCITHAARFFPPNAPVVSFHGMVLCRKGCIGLQHGTGEKWRRKELCHRMNALASWHRLRQGRESGFVLRKPLDIRPSKHIFFICSKGPDIRAVVCRNASWCACVGTCNFLKPRLTSPERLYVGWSNGGARVPPRCHST